MIEVFQFDINLLNIVQSLIGFFYQLLCCNLVWIKLSTVRETLNG
ncbi:MAG: hypothetical protein CM1200mP10_25980 [Candidatus Neomarinimicrobiota bacterium]|nr:MAG: hypothetical protein CM1200mP10_25980 [Candidatus Neomarinimicrobiota bacterium]